MVKFPKNSDKKILVAIRAQRDDAWDMLFAQHDPMIQSITRWPKWNFSEDEQLDVRQNIHVQLQSALPKFQEKSSLAWFIKRIAIHQCIDEVRRQNRWRTFTRPNVQQTAEGEWNEIEFQDTATPDPRNEAAQQERVESLRGALQHLNSTCKDSISLFYLKQQSYREISDKLGISVKTVGSRLSKCLDKLHQRLSQHPAFKGNQK
ncbi:RNA polymerase sigma factor [Verrucomicrobiota bacterium]